MLPHASSPVAERLRDATTRLQLTPGHVAALLVLASCACAGLVALWWTARPTPVAGPVLSRAPTASDVALPGAAQVDPAPSAGTVVVHVSGAVASEGVVELAAGARVIDAVEAAGGARRRAHTDQLNLARVVRDGEQIHVPTADSPPAAVPAAGGDAGAQSSDAAGTSGAPPGDPVDLNTASVAELEALPDVGPVLTDTQFALLVYLVMERTVKAAAVYVRISQDRGGEGLGVDRQETLCRQLADRKGWTVAEVYRDNDYGAYTGKPRPAYERMLADIEAGCRDAVLVVDTDRLTRHLRELEDFIELANRQAVALANVSGDLDLSTSDGRFRARIMGAVARQESEKKSDRLQREREQRATQGRPHPGPRAFGFRPGNMTHDLREAELIRDAATAILAGKSIRSVADEWNAAGITTARGNRWTIGAVGDVLTSPRTGGRRQHQGEIVGDGNWPAILDRDTWERLRTLAKSRRRRTGRPPTRLLSSIATCSLCDGPMHSSRDHGKAVYACRRVSGKKDDSCGRLSIVAAPLDAFVRDMIFAALDEGDLAERVAAHRSDSGRRDLTAELRADEEALEQLAGDYYVDRVITRGVFLRTRRDLEDRIKATRKLVAATAAADTLDELPDTGDELRVWWDAADRTGEERRQLVERLIGKVPILPRLSRMPRQFDSARIDVDDIVWRV